jgi:hypothetical protein
LATATIGAIGELAVSIFLLKKGMAVFRAISPACKCDLVAIKGNSIYRIEVTTGQPTQRGTSIPYHDPSNYDILAVTDGSENLRFYPDSFLKCPTANRGTDPIEGCGKDSRGA